MSATTDALVGSAFTYGRAAVDAEPAAGKTPVHASTAAFLAAVASAGVVNAAAATAGGAALTAGGAALTAGGAALATGRVDVVSLLLEWQLQHA
jgi:hypothetical protein